MNNCYLCGSTKHNTLCNGTRDLPNVDVLKCSECGLVFLSSFNHIDDNFYENSKIHENLDINEWIKSTENDDNRRYHNLINLFNCKRVVNIMDFGAGNLNLLTKLRAGFPNLNLLAVEPEKRIKSPHKNIIKVESIDQVEHSNFDIITMFHTIEHLRDPINTLALLKDKLDVDGRLIIETPNSDDALISLYECNAFKKYTYWGCHLYLFNNYTLKIISQKAGFKNIIINQIQRYPIINHLYWLSVGLPGGHIKWREINDDRLNESYNNWLSSMSMCDTLYAELRK